MDLPGEPAVQLARFASDLPGIRFRGIQAYEGHLVNIKDDTERKARVAEAMAPIIATRRAIEDERTFIDLARSSIWIGKEHVFVDRW